jgi:hypothetical protein
MNDPNQSKHMCTNVYKQNPSTIHDADDAREVQILAPPHLCKRPAHHLVGVF